MGPNLRKTKYPFANIEGIRVSDRTLHLDQFDGLLRFVSQCDQDGCAHCNPAMTPPGTVNINFPAFPDRLKCGTDAALQRADRDQEYRVIECSQP